MIRFNVQIILWAIACLLTVSLSGQESKVIKLNDSIEAIAELIYIEDYSTGMDNWFVEQMPGGTIQVVDETLEINDSAGCTTWFTKKLEGPVMIEYDAVVIDLGGPNDRVSDLNCFWMATDPGSPGDFFKNTTQRTGKFSTYDPLSLYYVGLGGHNNSKTRFRKYAGDGSKPLLPEHDLSDPEFLITPNIINDIRIIAYEGIIQFYRNDQLIFNFYDPDPYTTGYFGIRTVKNHMTVDDFRVYKLVRQKGD